MSRKKSDEVRVTEYFESADQAKVEVVFEIVKGIMRRRAEIQQRILEVKGERPKVQRRKRATKAEMAARKAAVDKEVRESAKSAEEHIPF